MKISTFKRTIIFAAMLFAAPALADGVETVEAKPVATIVKQLSDQDPLRLTSNKDQIIRLDKDAASIIVNNPAHAEVMLDSPRLLIIMPRQPGATSFKVLDATGEIILEKDIIVTNTQPQYVRVRRMCSGDDDTCVPAAYYYCPDGCYEVTPVSSEGSSDIPPPAALPGMPGGMPPGMINGMPMGGAGMIPPIPQPPGSEP